MMNTLTLLLVALSLPCCTGQRMESSPSSSVEKRPGETQSLSCRGSGFTFTCCGMNWIRQPAGKPLEWIGVGHIPASSSAYSSSVAEEISEMASSGVRTVNLKPEGSLYYCAKHTHWLK
ncbi:Ig heavy chain V region 3 [Lates japonicus]|uniref:Ig heavy chain V region 3 n=1 Tax=Lates japonicus TaxID=270547 RepID=A0AAD3MUE7_LATJO|nr:Ig heavy chain V region 3 [Lates japonicus]